jgi:ABC-type transport system involved in multi-copper enzyme maturation permease subunit
MTDIDEQDGDETPQASQQVIPHSNAQSENQESNSQPSEILGRDAEFMGESGIGVGGQTRMEVAFGAAGDEEEIGTASVAGGTKDAQMGAIFEQVYRPWKGTLNPRWARNWAMFRHHIYGLFSKGHRPWGWPTRLLLFGAIIAAMSDVGLSFLGAMLGDETLYRLFGVSRDNLYGHVLGFFPRNAICFPLIAALIIGGMISDDRTNGTSAIYFSRPINRIDYTAMKYATVATILSLLILGTLFIYYLANILFLGEGWAYLLDTLPLFLAATFAGVLLVITYSSIGLALSSVSRGRFFPAISLLGLFLGTKLLAFLIYQLFDQSILYLLSPYDSIAHVGQVIIGTTPTYDHPWTWSLVSIIIMNVISLYVLANRVSTMEVTRE